MKLKCYENGLLQKEEILQNGWIARLSYMDGDIVNIDLSDFTNVSEKTIEIEPGFFLKLIINDAPFLKSIYDIMESYKGMEIVRFESEKMIIVVEW